MEAKFLVVECNDNAAALRMVALMLEHGYGRLMLLDDLAQHPSLRFRSTGNSDLMPANAALRDMLSRPPKASSSETSSDILDLFTLSTPEVITIKGKIKDEQPVDEELLEGLDDDRSLFDFASSSVGPMELLARAQALTDGLDGPVSKKPKNSDPDKDYHTCQLCGTRVKAPRGGRWNLQMHVLAMHSSARPFKCPQCSYTDYRKPGMRKHTILSHGQDMDPVDISTEEKRAEWDSVMGKCFPEFAYRTGFLLENPRTSTPDTTPPS